jgi:toxin ParE1/3/4
MAFRVDFTEVAAEDLESISNFIGAENPEAASRVCRGLFELALSIGENPFMGRITPEYGDPNIRDIVRGNYRIVYLVHPGRGSLEILGFWHGARGFSAPLNHTRVGFSEIGQLFAVLGLSGPKLDCCLASSPPTA